LINVPSIKHIEPYFKIAEQEAKKSPCVRRQYGAVVVENDTFPTHQAAYNQRLSTCCGGTCARNRRQLRNGERVEVGAEIHAETAALIEYSRNYLTSQLVLVLVGYNGERELLGTEVYPCHTCAINIKYAGIKWVYIRNISGEIVPLSIAEILEYREAEWVPDV
jgi:deoxycytidylate deaminase